MQAKYKNMSRNGLKNGNEYIYDCNVVFDITTQEEMDLVINYASEISIKNNWNIDRLELED